MKIYLVKNYYGSYDSSVESIDKVYKTQKQAEDYIEAVKLRIKELEILYNNLSDIGHHDENDDIYDKAMEKFDVDFPDTYYDNWDGNLFNIITMDVE